MAGRDREAGRRAGDGLVVRTGRKDDLPELVRIYNHYVTHSIITFDTQPVTVESRLQWFERFSESVRYGARTAPQPTWMHTLLLECELADQPSDHNRNGKLG